MPGPPCMTEDGNPSVFVGTFLATGDPVAVCDECLVPWLAATFGAMTGVDLTPLLGIMDSAESEAGEPSDTQEAPQAEGEGPPQDPQPPTARNGRTPAGSSRAPTATESEPAETTADAAAAPADT